MRWPCFWCDHVLFILMRCCLNELLCWQSCGGNEMLQLMMFLMQHTALSMSILRNFKEKDKSTFHYLEYFLQEILMVLTLFFIYFKRSPHTTHTCLRWSASNSQVRRSYIICHGWHIKGSKKLFWLVKKNTMTASWLPVARWYGSSLYWCVLFLLSI